MKFGLPISFTLHALLAFGGLWVWTNKSPKLMQNSIIPVKLVTVADITDIKPTRSKDKIPTPKPANSKPTIPDISPPRMKPKPAKRTATKSPAVPRFDLNALAEAFEDVRKDDPDSDNQQVLVNENKNADIAENARLGAGNEENATVNALDYIRGRLHNCWIVDAGAVDYQNLIVDVRLLLNMDGSIGNITVLNDAEIIASTNRAWSVARHNATTALRKCAPYDGLLSIDYNVWKELKLHLDPGEN
jgi:hypothetical protein